MRRLSIGLAALALTMQLTVPTVMAGERLAQRASSLPSSSTPRVHDVALQEGGVFAGQIVDLSGRSLGQVPVTLGRDGERLIDFQSQQDGTFRLVGVTGGLYQLEAAGQIHHLRVWTEQAAPPAATSTPVIVCDQGLQRGQQPLQALFGCEPLLLGLLIAAAIAVPIAVHESRSDNPAGS